MSGLSGDGLHQVTERGGLVTEHPLWSRTPRAQRPTDTFQKKWPHATHPSLSGTDQELSPSKYLRSQRSARVGRSVSSHRGDGHSGFSLAELGSSRVVGVGLGEL